MRGRREPIAIRLKRREQPTQRVGARVSGRDVDRFARIGGQIVELRIRQVDVFQPAADDAGQWRPTTGQKRVQRFEVHQAVSSGLPHQRLALDVGGSGHAH